MVKFKAGFNPLSDYLFQVIEHDCIQHSELARCTVPELAAYLKIKDFNEQFWKLINEYKNPSCSVLRLMRGNKMIEYETLFSIMKNAQSGWSDFTKQWNKETRLLEETVCQTYNAGGNDLFLKFEEIANMKWPYSECYLYVSPFHPGAAMLKKSGCMFYKIINPEISYLNLARLIGHEGTHVFCETLNNIILSSKNMSAVFDVLAKKGVNKGLIIGWSEETLCIFLQHRLPVEYGLKNEHDLLSGFIDTTLQGNISYASETDGTIYGQYVEKLYWELQNQWVKYKTGSMMITDFLLQCITNVINNQYCPVKILQ